jgi:hypothetical protein
VHHVADAASGRIVTTMLDRPPAPLSRAERLSHLFDPSIFGRRYRLTPRDPYQASPLNWLTICDANVARPDGEDHVHWSLPRDFTPPDPPVLRAYFGAPPAGRCVATLRFAASLGRTPAFLTPHRRSGRLSRPSASERRRRNGCSSVPFESWARSAQDSNRPNHQQP